jgi:hypothetical protein
MKFDIADQFLQVIHQKGFKKIHSKNKAVYLFCERRFDIGICRAWCDINCGCFQVYILPVIYVRIFGIV